MTNYLPKLLITGGHGQLAQAFANHDLAKEYQLILCGRDELDISQSAAIEAAITKHLPDIIINAAAYTAVDKAEDEVSIADRINHIGAGLIALACEKNQIKLIHLSSDYVFDGTNNGNYLEDDEINPINIYGKSKWQGEEAIRNSCANHLILRVSGVFSEYGHNFLKTILQLARERTSLRVVSDQITCPTYAGDVAGAILTICKSPTHKGTYHYSSKKSVSWSDFAQLIIDKVQEYENLSVKKITPVTSVEYASPAKRPPCVILDCDKIKMTFDIHQPSWHEAINRIIPILTQEKA